ncbi:eukaryotic translation initiation factor 2-alpha kinase 1-like isoform X2 [Leguminivora glycinivorella]|uniref:eukaryotic translation initiation factor 2-alpha kinase 1-like isoform X2 n=1 Tax=Leguminivora glycinivorella TaxID=1035111 RepID=UPI00200D146F|nr:eukaryotic translation initiation factor 2-alpha kinase 1-like isoform X2 [Leguminivora glycinivorella]
MESKKDKWEALATVKAFDLGLNQNSHEHDYILHQSMQQVEIVQSAATTPISLLIQSLVKQLCALLEKDMTRANQLYNTICEKLHSMHLIDDSYAMGEFEAMRSQYQRALYQLVTVTTGSEIPITIPASWPIHQPSCLEWSRYHREFDELYYIAGGGFGSVFKAKHRLDGVEYAVKKVFIKSSDVDSIMTHLAEVKTLASLNHPNIVNYKAAWLEPMIESTVTKKKRKYQMDMDSDEFSALNSSLLSTNLNLVKSFKTHNSKELTKQHSQSDFIISFKNSSSQEVSDNSIEDFDETESGEDSDTPEKEQAVCKLIDSKEYENCSRVNLKWATLYIQMTFCKQTLKQWLDDRNNLMSTSRKSSTDLSTSDDSGMDMTPDAKYPVTWTHIDVLVDMFTQLVKGLNYIHSKGIIHHDVKPSNVFVAQSETGVLVQLGDFGLACPLQQSHSGLALGTHLYAAPEQLEGQCNPKSDMYSLGIILLELIEPFSTDMERVKTITDLRKGQIPAHLTANYPKIAHVIGKLVQRRPSKRLDTRQLLEELKNLSENKDETIKSLREELAAKDDEIAQLKMMLAKFSHKS